MLSVHLKSFGADEPAPAFEHRDVVGLPVAFFDGPGIGIHFVNSPGDDCLPIYPLHRCLDAEDVGTVDGVHHVGAVDEHFRGNAATVQTSTAERAFLHNGYRKSTSRRLGRDFKTRPGTNNHQIELLHVYVSKVPLNEIPPTALYKRGANERFVQFLQANSSFQRRYAPPGLRLILPKPYRGGKRDRVFSSLVMNSINAGCPVAITCLARPMAGIISAGSTTRSPCAPSDWARLA